MGAIGKLADRLLSTVLRESTAAAACSPLCDNTPICCRYTTTRFKWRACNSSCQCWWGSDC
jgi:hypothetical protein